MPRHSFIAIEGNIGAGKTTLSKMLAETENRRLILEEFTDNPFLPSFYRDPERYGFPVELFFMAERHQQLQHELSQPDLFSAGVVADYIFTKTLLFARNNLTETEFRLFNRLYRALDTSFPDPDLVVYLHRPISALRANIEKRARSFEADIADEYLASVSQAYLSHFRRQTDFPVLVIELEDTDFAADRNSFLAIQQLIDDDYEVGISRKTL